ncbi:hypothetical protein GCM10010405_18690 [Streptomyces macrosporus]|uniref:Uncharacterized protein n=1 Tax=Streptomyces macrosporus TaxID=44032 RepID=A0ABN3JSA4_9ACTN
MEHPGEGAAGQVEHEADAGRAQLGHLEGEGEGTWCHGGVSVLARRAPEAPLTYFIRWRKNLGRRYSAGEEEIHGENRPSFPPLPGPSSDLPLRAAEPIEE